MRNEIASPSASERRRPCCVKTSSSRFHRAASSSFRRSLGRPCAQLGCGRVLATFLWHWLAILNVAAGTIDHELGELGEVARAFEAGTTAARSAALIVPSCEGFLAWVMRTLGVLAGHVAVAISFGAAYCI